MRFCFVVRHLLGLLSFIYRRILLASIVRTGLLLSGRMPSTQLTLISEITLDSLIYSDYQGVSFTIIVLRHAFQVYLFPSSAKSFELFVF